MLIRKVVLYCLLAVMVMSCDEDIPVPGLGGGGGNGSLGLCIPPIVVDTSTVKMSYRYNDIAPIKATSNYLCTVPNILLGRTQYWVNGGAPGLQRIATLMLPTDVAVGTYELGLNAPYDFRYVPSGDANYSVLSGTVTVAKRDTIEKTIQGNFNVYLIGPPPTQPLLHFSEGCFWFKY